MNFRWAAALNFVFAVVYIALIYILFSFTNEKRWINHSDYKTRPYTTRKACFLTTNEFSNPQIGKLIFWPQIWGSSWQFAGRFVFLRPWQTRTHCCRHIVADTNVSPFARAQHLLRTQILCPVHKKCFRLCLETFCVRNKCFPVCAAQQTSWATMRPRLPGPLPQLMVMYIMGWNKSVVVVHGHLPSPSDKALGTLGKTRRQRQRQRHQKQRFEAGFH